MRRILPTVIDRKYDFIRSQERRLAQAVAKGVVKFPDIAVWSFTMPVILLFTFLEYRRNTEIVTLNFLFTKKLALNAAHDMIKNGQPRQDVLAQIDDKTTDVLASDKQGVYSEKTRRKQMNEVDLLLDHYLKLLKAEGESYESLVRDAYQTQESYETFLHELTLAERAVNRAAIQIEGKTRTTSELISKMETMADWIRREEAKKIFS